MILPNIVFEATGDAFTATIGEMFDIPEQNLDGQILEMVSGNNSYQEFDESQSSSSGTNANDDPSDQALIDLLPIPSENQSPDTAMSVDPFTGLFEF